MSNELTLQNLVGSLIADLPENSKSELAKFAIQKQLEIAATIESAKQSGVLHDAEVNHAISQVAALSEIPTSERRSTTINTSITSTDGRIRTTITSKKSLF